MSEPVYILGGGRTDFKRNLRKEGKTTRDLIKEAGRGARHDPKSAPADTEERVEGRPDQHRQQEQKHAREGA